LVVQLFVARRALLAERLPLHVRRGEKLPLKVEQGQDLAVPTASRRRPRRRSRRPSKDQNRLKLPISFRSSPVSLVKNVEVDFVLPEPEIYCVPRKAIEIAVRYFFAKHRSGV
jgi:hypothetical protein